MNKIVTLLLFFGIYCSALAQEGVKFYDACWDSVGTKAEAAYFSTPIKQFGKKLYQQKSYYISGELCIDQYYKDAEANIAKGMCRVYYRNGQLRFMVNFLNNYYIGELTRFYKTGELQCKEFYKNGKMKKCSCYTKSGADTSYFEDRSQPRFPDGNSKFEEYILNLPLYKQYKLTSKKHGVVLVRTWFDEKGAIINTKIFQTSGDNEMDSIAVQIVKNMPNWLPVLDEEDIPIKSTRTIDIKF